MSDQRITELKNKVMKVQEESLRETHKLLDQTLAFNQWAMDTQKQYMKMEQKLWHADWKKKYLEKLIYRLDPKATLYSEKYEEEIKNEKIKSKK